MKPLFCLLLIISNLFLASAQENFTITGKVIDKSKVALPYVSVTIKQEGKIVSGAITDESGNFKVDQLKPLKYQVEIQFMGFKNLVREADLTSGKSATLPPITLEEETTLLQEVTIVAERSTIEQKIDRKVINVGKDLTTAGATASDIMNNIPSVNVDQDGKISLRGNQNVRILIDGRPSTISADQLLKQIPSTSIKKIELITNPSAKYNPEGMSGIINIVLYKNANDGFNGSANAGVTVANTPKFNSSLNLNYRRGFVNVFGTYGNNFGDYYNTGEVNRRDRFTDQNLFIRSKNNGNLAKLGADFFLDDKNTFSIYTNQNVFSGASNLHTIVRSDVQDQSVDQFTRTNNSNHDGTYNFAFRRKFDKENETLDIEVNHSALSNDQDGLYFNDYLEDTVLDYSYADVNHIKTKQTTANIDFVYPFNEKSKLEAGTETRIVHTKTDYDTNSALLEPVLFNYNLYIYSAYATFGQTRGKFGYQLGLRFESYEVDAVNFGEKVYGDDYRTLYPSASFTYLPSDKNLFQLSYSRRVDRPSFEQVAPSRQFSTPLVTAIGNPELRPQFTNSVELNFIKTLEKGNISAGIYGRFIHDEINRINYPDPAAPVESGKQILTYSNFDDNTAFGFEVSGTYKITNWWDVQPSIDFSSIRQTGTVSIQNTDNDTFELVTRSVNTSALNARLNSNFKATKQLSFLLFGFYRSPVDGVQSRILDMGKVDSGARYSFLDSKATISLRFNDMFKTQRFRFEGKYPYPQEGVFRWESRSLYVGLNYMFGGGKNAALQRKQRDNNTKQDGGGMF